MSIEERTSGAVLITGASAGIGAELAREFAAPGALLVLTARREERLRELALTLTPMGARCEVIALDLAEPGAATRLVRELETRGIHVDVLVNNAGWGQLVAFAEQDPSHAAAMIQVNVSALTELTRLLLPGMLARGRGRVLNVASTAAFVPGPMMAVYYATKAYVLSFSVALAEEVRGTGVTVTALCPGPTTTEFQEVAGMTGARVMSTRMLAVMEARPVAVIGARAARAGRGIAVAGRINQLSVFAARFAPRWLLARIVRGINQRA